MGRFLDRTGLKYGRLTAIKHNVDKINFIWYTICVKLNSTMKIEYEKKI